MGRASFGGLRLRLGWGWEATGYPPKKKILPERLREREPPTLGTGYSFLGSTSPGSGLTRFGEFPSLSSTASTPEHEGTKGALLADASPYM